MPDMAPFITFSVTGRSYRDESAASLNGSLA